MAKFTFNGFGFLYQQGVESIARSYAEANSALSDSRERAIEELIGYDADLDMGKPSQDEVDDDGQVILSHHLRLKYDIESAERSIIMARKAFAIILYHHWEGGARLWTKNTNGSHKPLVAAVTKVGIELHPQLQVLYLLANALKHNTDKTGQDLLAAAQDQGFFPAHVTSGMGNLVWSNVITITDAAMQGFIDAVSKSGPTVSTEWGEGYWAIHEAKSAP